MLFLQSRIVQASKEKILRDVIVCSVILKINYYNSDFENNHRKY